MLVENVFPGGHWRLLTIFRMGAYFGTRVNPFWWLLMLEVWMLNSLLQLMERFTTERLPRIRLMSFSPLHVIRKLSWREATRFWWQMYSCTSDVHSFEQNYLEAWAHKLTVSRPPTQLYLFIGGEHIYAPMPSTRISDDAETLETLRMWYKLLQSRRGLAELLLPKKLTRVDKVKVRSVFLESYTWAHR